MSVEAFRLQNFMPFEDTDWIELKPICLLFGRNSSGKSAIIKALRFLRQSLNNQSPDMPFTYYAEHGVDVGDYRTVVHRQQVTRNMAFSFRCTIEHTLEEMRKKVNAQRAESELDPIPARDFTPWVELKLTYGWSDDDTQAQLKEFKIVGPWGLDAGDQKTCTLFGAQQLPSSATFSEDEWWFWSDLLLGHEVEDGTAWDGVSIESIHGFLPAFVIPPSQLNSNSPSFNDLQLADALLRELSDDISRFLSTIEYLGPIRPQPERVYAFDPVTRLRWERLGWGAFLRFLQGDIDQKKISRIDSWLQELDLGEHILPDKKNYAGDLAVVAQVKIQNSESPPINLVDTGYGASQVLPIIVECILAERDVLVIIEQPELHLHPRAQAQLADLFIEVAMRVTRLIEERKNQELPRPTKNEQEGIRVRFLIETHSEHILLRLRRRIAESRKGIINPAEYFHNHAFSVYFIDSDEKPQQSIVEPISIDARGTMKTPCNFRGFFADDLRETAFLAGARLGVDVDWEDAEDDSRN